MAYSLIGFSQQNTIRRYLFLRIAADGSRTEFGVNADIQTGRSCHVKLQDLPLMCRRLLEGQGEDVDARALTLTQADMQPPGGVDAPPERDRILGPDRRSARNGDEKGGRYE